MLSVCFALTAKLFRKKIRLIDFLGTFAFSYYPSLISMIITAIAQSVNPHLSTSIKEMAAQPTYSSPFVVTLDVDSTFMKSFKRTRRLKDFMC